MWTVVEFAGTDREKIVHETGNFLEAVGFVEDRYSPEESDRLGVDILRDGSTEY